MSTQRHELHLLTGSYALNALSGAERAAFRKHLTQCAPCAGEVRGMRETAARLAMATAIESPAEMRARVLAAAPLTRQLPPPGRVPAAPPAPAAQRGRRAARSRLIRPPQARIAAVLALAAAVAFLLVTQVTTRQELRQSQSASHAIAAVLAAPDARIETMPATVGGSVTAVLSVRQHEAVVTTAGLPAPAGSRIYQLWVMGPAGARSAGLLPASNAGPASPVLAAEVEPGDRLGVTVEPAGGTAQPTTTPVVVLPVPVVE